MLYGRYNEAMIKTELTVHTSYNRQPAPCVWAALRPCANFSGICADDNDALSAFFVNLRLMNLYSQ